MKIAILLLLCFLFPKESSALSRPDIDTVSMIGLTPGLDGKLVGNHVIDVMDTLLWNEDGTGITKFKGSYLGTKGEFRIAYDKGVVAQVSFVAPTHNQT